MRIDEIGKVYCIPDSLMTHNTDGKQSINSWKGYYDTRNWLDAVKRHFKKRYFNYSVFMSYVRRCSLFALLFRNRSNEFKKMCKEAIKDARDGRLGISDEYYPGRGIK